jgi:hypothetical protein
MGSQQTPAEMGSDSVEAAAGLSLGRTVAPTAAADIAAAGSALLRAKFPSLVSSTEPCSIPPRANIQHSHHVRQTTLLTCKGYVGCCSSIVMSTVTAPHQSTFMARVNQQLSAGCAASLGTLALTSGWYSAEAAHSLAYLACPAPVPLASAAPSRWAASADPALAAAVVLAAAAASYARRHFGTPAAASAP